MKRLLLTFCLFFFYYYLFASWGTSATFMNASGGYFINRTFDDPYPHTDFDSFSFSEDHIVYIFIDAYVSVPSQATLGGVAHIGFNTGSGFSAACQTTTSDGSDWDSESQYLSFKSWETDVDFHATLVGVRGSWAFGWGDIHW